MQQFGIMVALSERSLFLELVKCCSRQCVRGEPSGHTVTLPPSRIAQRAAP